MHLLQSGTRDSTLALWLGHESATTTHQYVEADLAMKEQALARRQEPGELPKRYRATDSLMEFLKKLKLYKGHERALPASVEGALPQLAPPLFITGLFT